MDGDLFLFQNTLLLARHIMLLVCFGPLKASLLEVSTFDGSSTLLLFQNVYFKETIHALQQHGSIGARHFAAGCGTQHVLIMP